MNKLLNKYEAIVNPLAHAETQASVKDNKSALKELQKLGPLKVRTGDVVQEDFSKTLSAKSDSKKIKNLGKI